MTLYGAFFAFILLFPFVRGIVDLWRRRWVWGVLMIAYSILLIFSIDGGRH